MSNLPPPPDIPGMAGTSAPKAGPYRSIPKVGSAQQGAYWNPPDPKSRHIGPPPDPKTRVNPNLSKNQFRQKAFNAIDTIQTMRAFSRPGGLLPALRYTLDPGATPEAIGPRAKGVYTAEMLARGGFYPGMGSGDSD